MRAGEVAHARRRPGVRLLTKRPVRAPCRHSPCHQSPHQQPKPSRLRLYSVAPRPHAHALASHAPALPALPALFS